MEIGYATTEELPQLCRLLAILFHQEAEFSPDSRCQAEGLRQIIDDPERGVILVLRNGNTIIGMVNLLFIVSTALGGRAAILEDMVLLPESRGKGGGSLLMKAAIQAAKSAGCLRITLLTDGTNIDAQRFYRRHGFSESPMIPMRMLIGQEQV